MKDINNDTTKVCGIRRITLYQIICIGLLFETMVGGVLLILSSQELILTINIFFLYYLLISLLFKKFEIAYNECDIKSIKIISLCLFVVMLINIGSFINYFVNIETKYNLLILFTIIIRAMSILNNLFGFIIIFTYLSLNDNHNKEIECKINYVEIA
jgi:hypothetical protein